MTWILGRTSFSCIFSNFFRERWGGPGGGNWGGADIGVLAALCVASFFKLRLASIFCPVLSISCLSRKHTMPKPRMESRKCPDPHTSYVLSSVTVESRKCLGPSKRFVLSLLESRICPGPTQTRSRVFMSRDFLCHGRSGGCLDKKGQ